MGEAEANKLFVARIVWEATDDILIEHFAKYGDVVSSVIVRDQNSDKHRGYAFVTFSESDAADRALRDSHEILGRKVEVKRAIRRKEQTQQHHRGLSRSDDRTNNRSNDQLETKKIFVGGLSADLTEEEFKHYFERFGRINDLVVMRDNITHRPRGFGFITFDSEDSAEEVMQKKFHELNGKLVEVKRAVPRDGTTSSINGHGGRWPKSNSYLQGSDMPFYSTFMYSPTIFNIIAGFPIPYGNGLYGGGYPFGGHGIDYGLASFPPRSHWGFSMAGVGGNFMPYGNVTPMYPAYLNGGPGMMGFTANGYSKDIQHAIESSPSQTSADNGESNCFGCGSKQNQKVNDKSCEATTNSS